MFGFGNVIPNDLAPGDVLHFSDGTSAKVWYSVNSDKNVINIYFDRMIRIDNRTETRFAKWCSWSNHGAFERKTGNRLVFYIFGYYQPNEGNNITSVTKGTRHFSNDTMIQTIKSYWGVDIACETPHAKYLEGVDRVYDMSILKAGDTVLLRDGQVMFVKRVKCTTYCNGESLFTASFPDTEFMRIDMGSHEILNNTFLYHNDGRYSKSSQTNKDIIAIISSGLSESRKRMNDVLDKKLTDDKKEEAAMTNMVNLKNLYVGDTVQFRDGQIACVTAIEETEYQNYPYKITFNRILSFDDGKLTINEAGYCENGWYGVFRQSSADIVAIIPSGLAERAAKVKKEYEQKQKQKEKKVKSKTVSLDKLKVGDRITFRDGKTVTATEVKRVDTDHISITFNKKVRMKEPSGVMMVDFEIFRLDGTVALKDWNNKDIVAFIPPEHKEMDANEKSSQCAFTERQLCEDKGTPIDLSKLRVGDTMHLRCGYRMIVSHIKRTADGISVEWTHYVKPDMFAVSTNHTTYSYDGKNVGFPQYKSLDVMSVSKASTVDYQLDLTSEVEALKAEVAELKKQIAVLNASNRNVKKVEQERPDEAIVWRFDENDGNMLFANKSKPKKKGKTNAN